MTVRKKATKKRATRKKKAARKKRAPRPKAGSRKRQSAQASVPGSPRVARVAPEGGGKPRVVIDVKALEKMAEIGMSHDDIAVLLDISPVTLETRIADTPEVEHAIKRGAANMRKGLRAAQIKYAKKGNGTMLVWTGKVILGQRETVDFGGGDDAEMDLTTVLSMRLGAYVKKRKKESDREAAKGQPEG